MSKFRELQKIAQEIKECSECKRGGTGSPVPGEGSADAIVMFVGEAPGKEEVKIGRPFVSRSGRFLRSMIRDAGLSEDDVFITSPVHYLPTRGTPSNDMIIHGREHLLKQVAVIDPRIIVLLGSTAAYALLDKKVLIANEHGTIVDREGRKYLITCHPAYAARFPVGRKEFIEDFSVLKKLIEHTKLKTEN